MEQRVTLITLGVDDLARSNAFWERLGWRRSFQQAQGVSFFQCGGIALALWSKSDLAADAGVATDGGGFGNIAIAHNGRSRNEVDAIMADAAAAGATVVKPPKATDWGGYSGYFRDLDGHLWEVAWNPGFPLDADGAVTLPP